MRQKRNKSPMTMTTAAFVGLPSPRVDRGSHEAPNHRSFHASGSSSAPSGGTSRVRIAAGLTGSGGLGGGVGSGGRSSSRGTGSAGISGGGSGGPGSGVRSRAVARRRKKKVIGR